MFNYIARRVFQALITTVVTMIAVFIMIRVAPGDPIEVLLGDMASDEEIAQGRELYGLDRPLLVQLGIYLAKAATLDFGKSITQGVPVHTLVLSRVWPSIELGVVTIVLTIVIGVALGLVAALNRGKLLDKLTGGGAFVALSLPDFWLGIVLILIFSRTLHLLPSSGRSVSGIIMPALTLALPLAAVNLRLMRNETIGVLKAPYVTLARARGLGLAAILRRHVLRNAIIPVLTVGGVQFGHLLGGAAVVESVFGWPGVGQLLIRSIAIRDYPVVQGCIIVMTVMVVVVNLLVDLAYRFIDPRFRTS
jgi:ABC-type dipeptide/oligopeptide/nickel transport system permease component